MVGAGRGLLPEYAAVASITRQRPDLVQILIIGAGGHGQCVADAVLRRISAGSGEELLGFLDDVVAPSEAYFAGVPVLGGSKMVSGYPDARVIVAVGDNVARANLVRTVTRDRELATVIDPTAVIGSEVMIGPGSYIGPLAIIGPGCRLGRNIIVNGGGCLGHHSVVGDHAHIGPGVTTARGALIGEGAMIGAGTVIKPDTGVGAGSVVGSGSVVSRTLPAHVTAAGAPARALRRHRGG